MMAATAPPTAPHIAGFTDADICIAKLLFRARLARTLKASLVFPMKWKNLAR
jgi:hypothetical protein